MDKKGLTIAIDGPAGSGKGTVSQLLAKQLNGFYIDSGAIYRAIALYCIEHNIDIHDTEAMVNNLSNINIKQEEGKTFLNSKNVSEEIRRPDVSQITPIISTIREVRALSTDYQRLIADSKITEGKFIINEGRDIGINVFKNASLKVYLTAKLEIRAKRRLEQLHNKDINKKFEEVKKELIERDERDSNRQFDPLVKEPQKYGYLIIDNSEQTIDETINIIMDELKRRRLING